MLQWRRQYGVVHKFTAPCSVVLPEAPLLTGKRVHSMNELLAAMRLSIRIFAKPFTVHKKYFCCNLGPLQLSADGQRSRPRDRRFTS